MADYIKGKVIAVTGAGGGFGRLISEKAAARGAKIACALRAPMVIGLVGDLGAGKTALVRALIQSLVPATRVKSPTYTLIESYELQALTIHHLDLYRLRHPHELDDLGLQDLLTDDAVMLIEWPEKGGDETPARDLTIRLSRAGDESRSLQLEPHSAAGMACVARLNAAS